MDVLKDLTKKHSGVPQSIKTQLKDYQNLFNLSYGDGKETVYSFTNKKRNQEKRFGRLYATSTSLQGLKKDFRSALAEGVLQDIDMVAAAPSIFKTILSVYNLNSKALDLYLENRDEALSKYKLKEKSDFLSVIFSEYPPWGLHPELMEMHRTLYNVAYLQIAADYPVIVQFSKERSASVVNKGSVMANVFQAVESVILMEAVEFFRERGIAPSVPCFDGVMLVKDERVNEQLLEELHQHTVQQTGFDVKWAEKPIVHNHATLQEKDFPDHCDDPKAFVAEVLQREPSYDQGWAWKVYYHIRRLTDKEDRENYIEVLKCYVGEFCHKDLYVGKYYFCASIHDPWLLNVPRETVNMVIDATFGDYMPQVKTRIFDFHKPTWGEPSGKTYIEHFNAFPGFAATNLGCHVERDEVAPYLNYILQVICSNRETEYTYVLKWVQELFKSSKANGVVLCITGLEGTGKGFFYQTLSEHLLGKELCLTLNNADQFLAQTFNSELENKSLVLFDEMPAVGFNQRKSMFDKLKNMTTDDKIVINEKGVRHYVAKNMNNFMINSNNKAILPLTATGHRVFCLKVSNIHRCDEEYFEQLSEFVKANANKIFTYIMNLDLSGIRLSKFPQNEDREAMVVACIDPVAALIKEFVDYGGFPRNLMEPGWAVEVEKVMDSRDIYSMYQKPAGGFKHTP
ncbi:hypothetical protein AMAG_18986 [Allomyces macrogynus ATCC 38327]|uniref:NrS-1 polymerase-like helicase domain-containing protein n=1 Tax=Allomyces macrogynus (strain ATCC 38327) TaxID=578462 RepID=A0A0L0SLK1_ALLM3|nr:hypothetical protein AMAG_18986 [Allomyces macrogynus ATCC 38327]|eukprot:KNE63328.1 hypothetical protein AMAG_18986 [Allomyces macrogynus ATCC 38327]